MRFCCASSRSSRPDTSPAMLPSDIFFTRGPARPGAAAAPAVSGPAASPDTSATALRPPLHAPQRQVRQAGVHGRLCGLIGRVWDSHKLCIACPTQRLSYLMTQKDIHVSWLVSFTRRSLIQKRMNQGVIQT